MRPDGDPERDDYGLPRVDVVVPDDARELERDLLAYRREERRRRTAARMRWLLRPFGRFGIAVPLIAGAVAIALVSGTLLTVLGPRPTPRPSAGPVAPNPRARPGEIGGRLPDGPVAVVTGKAPQTRRILDLSPGVIGIVPPGCRCAEVVATLAKSANAHVVKFWLVSDRRQTKISEKQSLKELRALAGEAHEGLPGLVQDEQGILAGSYGPSAKATAPGLTAVLVHTDGVVADILQNPRAGPDLERKIEKLTTASERPPG